jgi:hypothetical protein
MKVFVSWSGAGSKRVAETLSDWLKSVIQALDPWVSSEDMEKGTRWSPEIAKELADAKAGIVCVTPDNQGSPWLNFEAGALSNATGASKVCAFLVGMKPTDLKGPLSQFQATVADRADTRKLVGSLNRILEKDALSETKLEQSFAAFWPSFEITLEKLVKDVSAKHPAQPSRPEREILEETLGIARELRNEQASLAYVLQQIKRAQQTYYQPFQLSRSEGLLDSSPVTSSNLDRYLISSPYPVTRQSEPSSGIDYFKGSNAAIEGNTASHLKPRADAKEEEQEKDKQKR